FRVDIEPGIGGTHLSTVESGSREVALYRSVDVGIGSDHTRCLAAQFQGEPFEVGVRTGPGDPFADIGGAGVREMIDVGVCTQHRADLTGPVDKVDHPRW